MHALRKAVSRRYAQWRLIDDTILAALFFFTLLDFHLCVGP
jgi:hypothetical protein